MVHATSLENKTFCTLRIFKTYNAQNYWIINTKSEKKSHPICLDWWVPNPTRRRQHRAKTVSSAQAIDKDFLCLNRLSSRGMIGHCGVCWYLVFWSHNITHATSVSQYTSNLRDPWEADKQFGIQRDLLPCWPWTTQTDKTADRLLLPGSMITFFFISGFNKLSYHN